MDPKSQLISVVVLGTILLHAPSVYGCVNFKAGWADENYRDPLDGYLNDDRVQRCAIHSGNAEADGLHHFTCDSGFSCTFDSNTNQVNYNPPWGTFRFKATFGGGSTGDWTSCQYNCNTPGSCFGS